MLKDSEDDTQSNANNILYTLPPKVPLSMQVVVNDKKVFIKTEKNNPNHSPPKHMDGHEKTLIKMKLQNNNGNPVSYSLGHETKILLNRKPNVSILSSSCKVGSNPLLFEKNNQSSENSVSIKKIVKLPESFQRSDNRSPSPILTLNDFLRDD